ncbi:MAG TPA: hypothetical protein VN081_04575 [Dongiaceae bacterium]|nr:hypothetical protein [Dongiaceae bacterium]
MTAREVARELVNIQHLTSLYLQAVANMRAKAVKTLVDNLWRRYRAHQKREDARSFVEWLVWKQHFEETFWHVGSGTGQATRRRWAFGYFNFFIRKELTLADDPNNLWMFDALERALNDKAGDPDWLITVETVNRDAIPRYQLKAGVAFMFGKVEREDNLEEGFLLSPEPPLRIG